MGRFTIRKLESITLIGFFLVFLMGSLAGWIFSSLNPGAAKMVYNQLRHGLSNFLHLSGWRLVVAIFLNNARVGLMLVFFGILLPFIIDGLFLLINGFVVGLVAWIYYAHTHQVLSLLESLLPHGILELPAIFITATAGSLFGVEIWRFIFGKLGHGPQRNLKAANHRFWSWVFIGLFLLIPAAMIEVFISPLFLPTKH